VSEKNVELVRNTFQTFSAEGIDAALCFFSPDFVWYTTDRWIETRPIVGMTACEGFPSGGEHLHREEGIGTRAAIARLRRIWDRMGTSLVGESAAL
jgi:hypothetical protein